MRRLAITLGPVPVQTWEASSSKAVRGCGAAPRCPSGPGSPDYGDYGERYRRREAISSAFVESTVNQVVSKRRVNKQQMR